MKTLFAILGLFMFASVSTTDVKKTTSKEDVKGYYLTADSGGNKTQTGTGLGLGLI